MARRRTADRRARVPEPRRPVRWAPVLGLSLVLFTGGWTLLWLFARAEAQATFAQWLDSERGFGRVWTCPDQAIGGFPLGIELSCEHPTFKGPVGDGVVEGSLAGVSAATRLYFPTKVAVTLVGPLQATDIATRRRLEASWSSAVLTLRGLLPNGLDRGQLEASDLQVAEAGQPQGAAQVGQLAFGFKPITRPSDARFDLEMALDADRIRIPALDASVGSADPLDLHVSGLATQVRLDGSSRAADVLGPWSRAGGQVQVQAFDANKGPMRVTASGRFGLDEEHRFEGRFDTGFTGLGPVADRIGLPLGVLKVGGALASLLGGGKADAPQNGSDLTLPVVARNGVLTVGPVRTPVRLDPVY